MWAPRKSAFRISTRCCTPTGRSPTARVEIDLEAVVALERLRSRARARATPARSVKPPSAPSSRFSSTVNGSTSMKCWWTMPMPARDRVLRAVGSCRRLAVDQDLAAVGLVEAVEDVHQRRLAGAVLADDAVDRAGRDDEVDVAVGVDRAEALVDAAQLDRRRRPARPASGVGASAAPSGAADCCVECSLDLELAGDDRLLGRVELRLHLGGDAGCGCCSSSA